MTTRIADLPENITVQMNNSAIEQPPNTTYIPPNVYPNPYGIPNSQTPMPNPQPSIQLSQSPDNFPVAPRQPQYLSEQQQMDLANMQQRKLPSRDIPIDTLGYLHDESIQPNYIPKPKLNGDYVRDYEDVTDKKLRNYEEVKHRESKVDAFFNEFQVPLLIMILFFIFQLPIINSMIFKKFSFLSLHDIDGNFNIYGLLFKSILFGGLFYLIQKSVVFISEF